MKEYIKAHKIRLTILVLLLIAALIIALFSLESSYNYAISEYEMNPDNISACEDSIATLSRMKYYKNSRNYIRQIKRTIIMDYCASYQFDEAKKYLDRNYEKSLEDMYDEIEKSRADYEKAQEEREYNSAEGRTKRIEKMYNEMGIGGCDEDYYVFEILASDLQHATLHDIEYTLPIWNRNET